MPNEPPLRLVDARDETYAALLGESDAVLAPELHAAPGGVDAPAVIAHIRALLADLGRTGFIGGHWLMVVGDEIVGLCGLKAPLSPDGAIEIGYSVAASRRRRGHASAAVSAMIECTPALGARSLTAATAFDNLASQRVLERNGFACVGTRSDPDDGPLRLWRRPVSGPEQSEHELNADLIG